MFLLLIQTILLLSFTVFFSVSVDSYTDQDWKKLQAAVNALKSPVLRDDIELDPSAIGQFLHTDYIHSLSTPNIHELQLDASASETDVFSPPPPSSVPHSSTMYSFPNYALVGPAAATDQMPRKARVHSTRSIKRQRIVSMAEAGDRLNRENSSNQTSCISSAQGSPTLSSRPSYGTSTTNKTANISKSASKQKKKKGGKSFKSSAATTTSNGASAIQLAKNLNQGAIVYDKGKYRKIEHGYICYMYTDC